MVAALVTAACGTQVPRAEIEAAAGGPLVRDTAGQSAAPAAPQGGSAAPQGGSAAPQGGSVAPQATGDTSTQSSGSQSSTNSTSAGGGGSASSTGQDDGSASGGGEAAPGQGQDQPQEQSQSQSQPQQATRSPVKLGHIGTYSGVLGSIFAGGREMVQVWARSVNERGGLNGHPVEVVTGDDGGDPSRNLSLTRDMVENQGVVGFVGNIVPLSLTGSIDYLEDQGIPLIGGDLVDQAWYSSPMVFPQGGKIDGSLRGSAQQAVEVGGPRVALLYCGEASACFTARDLFQGGAVADAGGELVYSAQVSLAQPDFTAECSQMQSNDVDALVATVDGNTLSRIAQACAQQNVDVQYVSFSLALVDSLRDDPNLQGLVGSNAFFPWMVTDGPARQYAEAVAKYAPNLTTSGATAAVWSSGKLVEAAGRSLPEGEVTSQHLVEGLLALDGETLGGLTPPLTFRQGQPPPLVTCYFTIALTNEQFRAPQGLETQGC